MESTTTWLLTLGILSLVIVFDLTLAIIRRNKETTMTEAGIWTVIYVAAAIAFGILMPNWTTDANAQKEFFAGWLTEYALSVDNIFVFVIILSRLQVEKTKQQLVLLLGIIIALVLRGGFIAAGSAIIEKFSGAFFIFGAFLIFTAYRLLVEDEGEEEWKEDRLVTFLRSKGATTFVIALVSLGFTDLVFALDSIPAIFGITRDPYIVVCANIFALMGLRQLYFLLQGLLQRLVYLSKGLSFILAFIGFKMFIEAFHGIGIHEIAGVKLPHVAIEVSLFVIVAALTVTAVASLTATRKDGSEIV
ncbi:TerC Membrane protein TerC, possibly involved in tellurium resistance [Candidatus Nanopelagicaceae bacterium]|jgi:tellurite resistance protein TerC